MNEKMVYKFVCAGLFQTFFLVDFYVYDSICKNVAYNCVVNKFDFGFYINGLHKPVATEWLLTDHHLRFHLLILSKTFQTAANVLNEHPW